VSDAVVQAESAVTPPGEDPLVVDWRRARRFLIFCAAVGALTILVATLYASLCVPLGVSAFLTYLLLPFVGRLERRGVPRSLAALAIIALSLAILSLAVSHIVPLVYKQGLILARLLPSAVSTVADKWVPELERSVADLGFFSADDVHGLFAGAAIMSRISAQLQATLTGLWHTGTSLVGGVVKVVMIPVFSLFLMIDYPRFKQGFLSLLPLDLVLPARLVKRKIDVTLRSVIKGQATVACILAGLYVVGLSVVGLQSAIAIGVIAGVCRVIPYFDVVVGGTLSLIVLLSDFRGWGQALSVVLVFVIVQATDGAFVTPRVLGERVGLHPLVVIASVLAFGDWLGFWGVLLAIPIVAIIKALLEAAKPYYLASRAYDAGLRRERGI
jgi:predicted PurR-regulated permease PerM